jgi:hypothetical protein
MLHDLYMLVLQLLQAVEELETLCAPSAEVVDTHEVPKFAFLTKEGMQFK